MAGVTKIEIKESVEELRALLRQQKTASGKERIQALYLLKTQQVKTVQHLAMMLGRGRITLQRWLRLYRESGCIGLLEQKKSSGRPPIIKSSAREQLKIELVEPIGTVNGRPMSARLLTGFAQGISDRLDLNTLEENGIFARLLQLEIDREQIALAGFVRMETFDNHLSWLKF